jgi:hypothetical protein
MIVRRIGEWDAFFSEDIESLSRNAHQGNVKISSENRQWRRNYHFGATLPNPTSWELSLSSALSDWKGTSYLGFDPPQAHFLPVNRPIGCFFLGLQEGRRLPFPLSGFSFYSRRVLYVQMPERTSQARVVISWRPEKSGGGEELLRFLGLFSRK